MNVSAVDRLGFNLLVVWAALLACVLVTPAFADILWFQNGLHQRKSGGACPPRTALRVDGLAPDLTVLR